MSYTGLFSKVAASAVALTMGGCAVIDSRTAGISRQPVAAVPEMGTTAAVVDPCIREGIDARPSSQVSHIEMNQNLRAGRKVQNFNGWTLFSDVSLSERFAPLGGLALGVAAGSLIGGGSVRAVAMVAGGVGGAVLGEGLGKAGRVEDLTNLAACRQYLNAQSPSMGRRDYSNQQPAGRTIYNGYYPDGRPIILQNNPR